MRYLYRSLSCILFTALLSISSSANANPAGEDWPFKCVLNTNWDVTEFYIYESDRRDSGYELSFYNFFGVRRTMEVWLEYDPSWEVYTFTGSHMTRALVSERHMKAIIPIDMMEGSSSGQFNAQGKFKLTLPGGAPQFEERLGAARCFRDGPAVKQERHIVKFLQR